MRSALNHLLGVGLPLLAIWFLAHCLWTVEVGR